MRNETTYKFPSTNARVKARFSDGEFYPGRVKKVMGNRVRVQFDDGDEATVPPSAIKPIRRGRESRFDSLSKKEVQTEIDSRLRRLGRTKDENEKRALRRQLRRLGHRGGLAAVAD